jgi:hypothetical protein
LAEPEKTGRKQGRFPPGSSGNPDGRPRGSRHRALRALDSIGERGAIEALRTVVRAAARGDIAAAKILLDRVWRAPNGRVVRIDLPTMTGSSDLVAAAGAVVDAVATGELTPEEAQAVMAVLDGHRRAVETAELQQRVADLERGMKERG